MDILGFQIPLWAICLGGLLIVIISWKLIKFAIKIFVILVLIFLLLIGLDVFGVFQWIQTLISSV